MSTEQMSTATELNELVNMENLRLIRDNLNVVYERMGKEAWVYDKKTRKWIQTDFKTLETTVNAYYQSKVKGEKIKYRYDAKTKYGRRVAESTSLQGVSRQIRQAISKDLYYDIDIKNAHPVILLRWCKAHNFAHPHLQDYVANRDQWINDYSGFDMSEYDEPTKSYKKFTGTKDTIKKSVLAKIYGGKSRFVYPDQRMIEFEKRQEELADDFYNESRHPENKKHAERARKNGKEHNKKGSCLSYYLCEVEDQILQHMEAFANENDIKVGALCFDGFMVCKKDVDEIEGGIDELCASLSNYVSEKMGFPFQLLHKEMGEAVSLEGLEPRGDLETTDSAYGKYLYMRLKDGMKYHGVSNKLYVYDEETRLWKQSQFEYLFHHIPSILIPLIETSPDPKIVENEKKRISSTPAQRSIIVQLKSHVCSHPDDAFIINNFDNKQGVFPIADNKVIELQTGIVRNRTKEDYFTKTTNRKIVPMEEASLHEYVFNYHRELLTVIKEDENGEKIYVYPTPEHVECLLYCMAYMLTGENSLKKFINLIGTGDNGKSLFVQVYEDMIEGFAVNGNKRTFIKQKNDAVHDAEKVKLLNTRMVILSELAENDEFNETFLKKMTGGDKDDIRECGGRGSESIQVRYSCIPLIATNQLPKISDDQAFRNRLLCFHFGNKFTPSDEKKKEVLSHLDLFFTNICHYAKKYYDNGKKIVISKEAEKYTDDKIKSKDSVLSFIDDKKLEKTANKNDYILLDDLYSEYSTFATDNSMDMLSKSKFVVSIKKILKLEEKTQRTNAKDLYGNVQAKPYVFNNLKMVNL